jgi:hypothetical protein
MNVLCALPEKRPRALRGGKHVTEFMVRGSGAQLLVALAPRHLTFESAGPLRGLMSARNKGGYEHDFLPCPPRPEDVERYLQEAREIITRRGAA